MRYILDQNMSQLPELESILESGNEIILTDDYFVEPFKHFSPNIILTNNLKILRNYTNQIFITYDRGDLVRKELKNCSPITSDEIIDIHSTKYIRNLLQRDEDYFLNDIKNWKEDANKRISYQNEFLEKYIRNVAKKTSDLLKKSNEMNTYKTNKIKRLNNIKDTSFEVLKLMLKDNCIELNNLNEFENKISVNFSHIFIHLWRVVDWAIKGGFQNSKSIKGDSFDIKYILISCFFDGILTNEKWMKECRDDLLSTF